MPGPIVVASRIEALTDTADAFGKPIASSGTAHTKGSWVELTASTAFDYEAIIVYVACRNGYTLSLTDVGIGGAGSERVLVPDLLAQHSNNTASDLGARYYAFPIPIAAGTRVVARCQVENTSVNGVRCNVYGMTRNPFGFRGSLVKAYGSNAGTTRGTSIDPGGTANTKGSWTTLSSSIPDDIIGLQVALGSQGNTAMVLAGWHIDIGIGSTGDQIIVPDIQEVAGGSGHNAVTAGSAPLFPIALLSGTLLKARASCSSIDATDRLIDVVAYGVVP